MTNPTQDPQDELLGTINVLEATDFEEAGIEVPLSPELEFQEEDLLCTDVEEDGVPVIMSPEQEEQVAAFINGTPTASSLTTP